MEQLQTVSVYTLYTFYPAIKKGVQLDPLSHFFAQHAVAAVEHEDEAMEGPQVPKMCKISCSKAMTI